MRVIMFPGQGSQFKGMGIDLFRIYKQETKLASDILGYDIENLCLKNPNRNLDKTEFTQPALYVVNALNYYELQKKGQVTNFFIGHSLGEYNALLAAEAFTFETGLKLVQRRGELMAKAAEGSMAAVLGLKIEELKNRLGEGDYHDIDIANYNTPTQTVIAGKKDSIIRLLKYLDKLNIKAIPLNVSAPFHSRYMQPAAAEFALFIQDFDFFPLQIPVISNVTALPYHSEEISNLLVAQIRSSVKWTDSLLWLIKNGVKEFQEIEGKMLTKMVNEVRIYAETDSEKVRTLNDTETQKLNNYELKTIDKQKNINLGSGIFKKEYNVKYTYLVGSMYSGISSKEMVVKLGRSYMLGFLGTKEMSIKDIEKNILWIQKELNKSEPYGLNLFHSMNENLEKEQVELYLKHNVRVIETAGFFSLTPALVRYRLQGLLRGENGEVICKNKIIAKISRPEEAELFMNPAPEVVVEKLLEEGLVTKEQAMLSKYIPMSYDICVEADSGWKTNRKMANVLLPSIQALREQVQRKHQYPIQIRVGLAGGIGTPQAAASAYIMGADFIMTGSINQCTIEAGTSEIVKDLLQKINVHDTDYLPITDILQSIEQVQILKKDVMFLERSNKLYDLYKRYDMLEDIPQKIVKKIEKDYFRKSLKEVCNEDKNREIVIEQDSEKKSKQEILQLYEYYYKQGIKLSLEGNSLYQENFQIHTGSSLGAFNQWIKGTYIENWKQRHVDEIGILIMDEAIQILKKNMLILFQNQEI